MLCTVAEPCVSSGFWDWVWKSYLEDQGQASGALDICVHKRTLSTVCLCFPLISLWQEDRLSFELTRFQGAGLGCSSVFFSGCYCG